MFPMVFRLPPMDDVNHETHDKDGEDTQSSLGVGRRGNVVPRTGAGQGNPSSEASIEGVRIGTPRNTRTTGTPSQSSNFSELMQFMLMRANSENRTEQRRHQEREELEERRCHERE
jgi:hypothetical protein